MKYAEVVLGGKLLKIAVGEWVSIVTDNATIYLHPDYAGDIREYAKDTLYAGEYLGDVEEVIVENMVIMMHMLKDTDIVIMQEFLR